MMKPHLTWLEKNDTMTRYLAHSGQTEASLECNYLARFPELKNFEYLLESNLNSFFKLDRDGYVLQSISPELEQALQSYPISFQSTIRCALGHPCEMVPVTDIEHNAAWLVVARVFGRYSARTAPTVLCYQLLYPSDPLRPPQSYCREFSIAFQEKLASCPEQRKVWTDFFCDYATRSLPDLLDDTYKHRKYEREVITSLSEVWKKELDPFSIIKESKYIHEFTLNGNVTGFIRLIKPVDINGWIRAIENLPIPNLMEPEIAETIDEIDDEDAIMKLITESPLLFDRDGKWTHSCSILLLCHSIVRWIGSIQSKFCIFLQQCPGSSVAAEAKAHLEQIEKQDTLLILKLVYQAVISRADGKRVLIFFLEHYTGLCLNGFYGKTDASWVAERVALDALALTLIAHDHTIQHLEQTWRAREVLAQTSSQQDAASRDGKSDDYVGEGSQSIRTSGLMLLLSAIKIWQHQRDGVSVACQADAAFLWEWIESVLLGFDPGLSRLESEFSNIPVSAFRSLADVLAHHEHPEQVWKKTFAKLENQRLRMCFRKSSMLWRYSGSDVLNCIALFCVNYKSSNYGVPVPHAKVVELHYFIWDSSWFLYLTARPGVASNRKEFLGKMISQIIGIALLVDSENSVRNVESMFNQICGENEIIKHTRIFVESLIKQGKILPDTVDGLGFLIK